MWYRKCQEELNLNKSRQTIPSGGSLEVTLKGGDFHMGPGDPPKMVTVESGGVTRSIILAHGTPDGMVSFPGEDGKIAPGSIEEFNKWRAKKGWQNYGYVACYGNKAVHSDNADVLIGATGAVSVGEKTMPDGTKKLVFSE